MTPKRTRPVEKELGRKELAAVLGVTDRTITDWIRRHPDFPSRIRGRGRSFPIARCVQWYVAYKVADAEERASPREQPSSAESRKKEADAQLAEFKVAQARQTLITVHDAAVETTRFCDSLRAVVRGLRSRYASRVLNMVTVKEANRTLDTITRDLLEDLDRAVEHAAEDDDSPETDTAA